jgi:hypothetical protein
MLPSLTKLRRRVLRLVRMLPSLTIRRRVLRLIHRPATLAHMLIRWYRRCRHVYVCGDLKRINHIFIYNIPKPSSSRFFKTHTHTIHHS